MGYFPKKISRQRCGAHAATAERRQARALSNMWHRAPASPPDASRLGTEQFLRFAAGAIDPDSHQQLGLFRGSDELKAMFGLDARARAELREVYGWFDRHLQSPSVVAPRSVFWFRAGSDECISRIWRLVHLYCDQGVPVWMMRTRRPGKVVYEDEHQVAAVPFADPPPAKRRF